MANGNVNLLSHIAVQVDGIFVPATLLGAHGPFLKKREGRGCRRGVGDCQSEMVGRIGLVQSSGIEGHIVVIGRDGQLRRHQIIVGIEGT